MAFEIYFLPEAEQELRALDVVIAKRILKKLSWVISQKDPVKHGKMLHKPAIGDVRFRIGDYRVVVLIQGKRIAVVAVGHRRSIYR